MTQKWNLQDIKRAEPRRRRPDSEIAATIQTNPRQAVVEDRDEAEETMSIRIVDGNKKQSKLLIVSICIFLFVICGGVAVSALLGGAEVTVHPKNKEQNLNAEFETKRVAQQNELSYEIMTLEAEGERQVKASGEEEVTAQATGELFIYNESQKEPLRLVTNTRFESSDGKIYKIKDSAVIPGYTMEGDKKVPGMTKASVYAEQPGQEYNVAPGKFTVPGFKGEPEYTTIYAESTEAFKGGFNGKQFKIDDAEMQTAKQALQTELRDSLLERVYAEKPAGFILFNEAVTFTYETLPSVAYGENLATIKEKVYLRVPLFKEEAFASFIAKQTLTAYGNEPVRIADTNTLTFSYVDQTVAATDISNVPSLLFKITGKPHIIWTFDSEKLRAELVNAEKTKLDSILKSNYPAIVEAKAVIKPFWKTKFPTKIDEITITEVVKMENQ